MANSSNQVVQKLWNYCNILRDDGLSYGEYLEQLTFLLFLKMADEQTRPPFNKKSPIPEKYSWPELLKRDGDELEIHYRRTLEELGKEPGLISGFGRKDGDKSGEKWERVVKSHRICYLLAYGSPRTRRRTVFRKGRSLAPFGFEIR